MPKSAISAPNRSDKQTLFSNLARCKTKPVFLSLMPGYNDSYMSHYQKGTLPKPLSTYFDEQATKLDYSTLLRMCENLEISHHHNKRSSQVSGTTNKDTNQIKDMV
jgi:hypothetical protein